ncbi:uncharacterized protein LDX57_005122 [Aspergillus melleus]|uniref:uncharacterized protein n=1 Tax=Aspergillus melleus TaxID=138277 RepID=UPI001E8D977F|nr:uncharacterized protein LDX57_005122 [Aspergillus melleus]KAH8427407.1 hypothetical protein LDX57_005122 [Aspergillus melleus]
MKHRPAIKQSTNQKLLLIGIFAEVYLVDDKIIRKAPRSPSREDAEPICREAAIYSILGDHPRIAQCLPSGHSDYVDIQYYPRGDLVTYCRGTKISPDLQAKWFQQIIEAVAVIHRYGIIHSDLALRQFFVDDDLNVRLGDFNSSQYPGHLALGYEKASHCLPRDYEMPNTVASDLFALGSTLYELIVGSPPYQELYPIESQDVLQSSDHAVIRARVQRQHLADAEVEERFRNQLYPDVSGLLGGEVILACWRGEFSSAEEALARYSTL